MNWYKTYKQASLPKEAIIWRDVWKGLMMGALIGVGTFALASLLGRSEIEIRQMVQTNPQQIAKEIEQKVNLNAPIQQPQQPQQIQQPQQPQSEQPAQPQKQVQQKASVGEIDFILEAIHQMESSGGINTKPRFEPLFLKNYGNKGLMPELRKRYGDKAAASSYGPYQIMLVKAWEMGYKYSPQELAEPTKNKEVAKKIVQKYMSQGKKPWEVFKRYNGADDYADRALQIYNKAKSKANK